MRETAGLRIQIPMWTHQLVFQRWDRRLLVTFNCLDETLNPKFLIVGIPGGEKRAVCPEPARTSIDCSSLDQ
jgi:hypothetical protein